MEKDHEEYNIGVLDIYGFEIFQVKMVINLGFFGGGEQKYFCTLEEGRNPPVRLRASLVLV